MELIFHTDLPHALFHNLNYLNCAQSIQVNSLKQVTKGLQLPIAILQNPLKTDKYTQFYWKH